MTLDKAFFDELEARIPKGKVRTRFAPCLLYTSDAADE